ncbi:MAG: DMT family transporter [Anaerolineales bacterium]|nr:DMT family transporter [Anaerolineales bacterium]
MLLSHLLGISSALFSATLWGAGDFCGGLASRRMTSFQALVISSGVGSAVLLALALLWGERLPGLDSLLWAALAGVAGLLGLAALFRGLSLGNAAVVSPTAGVIGTALPVVFGAITEGLPSPVQGLGFLLALAGIWLAASSPLPSNDSQSQTRANELSLAVLAGIGFGGFFILVAQVDTGALFAPLAAAKLSSLGLAIAIVHLRGTRTPGFAGNPAALLSGVLDAGANGFYLLATRFTRLDVAVVLSSLYPAGTVLLARWLLKEQVSPSQWLGVLLCVAAIGLIAA